MAYPIEDGGKVAYLFLRMVFNEEDNDVDENNKRTYNRKARQPLFTYIKGKGQSYVYLGHDYICFTNPTAYVLIPAIETRTHKRPRPPVRQPRV